MTKINAGIIGATGYAGAELIRLLANHPNARVAAVASVSYTGQTLSQVYPHLAGICDLALLSPQEAIEQSDVIFAAVPHGVSQELAKTCADAGKAFIDIGADFRLDDAAEYEKWYGKPYQYPELHQKAVYGLCELFRDDIKKTRIIGNPGCYPTSIALGLAPALQNGLIDPDTLIIDAKSGATGAGRKLAQNTHFPDCNETFAPYAVGAHRHTPEIEQTLSKLAGKPVRVTFVPHLLPLNRGIVSTMYAKTSVSLEQLHAVYTRAYADEPFVRVAPLGAVANLKNVRMSNFCDVSLHADEHTGRAIIVSAIDNLVKGAAGQAVQNMNLVFGFAETAGLELAPSAF